MTSSSKAATKKDEDAIKKLPLVPQAILKRRQAQEDRRREKQATIQAFKEKEKLHQHNKKIKLVLDRNGEVLFRKKNIYVKKAETILAAKRMKVNHLKRFKRVKRHGMGKRASDKPIIAEKVVEEEDDDDDEIVDDSGNMEEEEKQEADMQDEKDDEKDDDEDDDDDDDDKRKEETPNKKTKQSTTETNKKAVTTLKYQANSVGASMVFVIRIRDHWGCPDEVKTILNDVLQLREIHTGVFLRYTVDHRKLLQLVEPWVTYGTPSKAIVADLIERRAYGRKGVQLKSRQELLEEKVHLKATGHKRPAGSKPTKRVPLADNVVIEEALGACCNILCKEDVVHELCRPDPTDHFDHVCQFLWPFQLSDAKTKMERSLLKAKVAPREEYGDKGEAISEYIKAVL